MDGIQNLNLIGPLVSEIWIFKLILTCKFQNVPCALGFEGEHSKFFCVSFRACIIIYLLWNLYLKLLYMPWNLYRKIDNVLLQNLMRMEHFEICILKLI